METEVDVDVEVIDACTPNTKPTSSRPKQLHPRPAQKSKQQGKRTSEQKSEQTRPKQSSRKAKAGADMQATANSSSSANSSSKWKTDPSQDDSQDQTPPRRALRNKLKVDYRVPSIYGRNDCSTYSISHFNDSALIFLFFFGPSCVPTCILRT